MDTIASERRLAAILAADVVGYSRLIESDETSTLAAIRKLRAEVIDPLLAKHHGRIVKLMGDGAIVEFGSVVDAVSCAVALQKETAAAQAEVPAERRIVFRIGINLGDVVVEGDDLLGDGVNVAARLEQLCDPGGVLLSGTAYDQMRGKLGLPLDFAGEQKVKNIAEPVRAYRVRLDGRRQFPGGCGSGSIGEVCCAAAVLLVAAGPHRRRLWWMRPVEPASASTSDRRAALRQSRRRRSDRPPRRRHHRGHHHRPRPLPRDRGDRPQLGRGLQGQGGRYPPGRPRPERPLRAGRLHPAPGRPRPRNGAAHRSGLRNAHLVRPLGPARRRRLRRPDRACGARRCKARRLYGHRHRGRPGGSEAQAAERSYGLRSLPARLGGATARTQEDNEEAIGLLKQSLEIDPGLARAWTSLSFCYAQLRNWAWPTDPSCDGFKLDAARRAVELDPLDAYAHAALGEALAHAGDLVQAQAEYDKALSLNPNSADILTLYSGWASTFGKPEEGVAAAERAMRLNPNPAAWVYGPYRWAFLMGGRYEEALEAQERRPRETYGRTDFVERAAILACAGSRPTKRRPR